jgi:hypothetical protein
MNRLYYPQTRGAARRSRNGDASLVLCAIEFSAMIIEPRPDETVVSAAAERLQDLACTMREYGLELATCEQIEALAFAILTAPSLHAPGSRRAQKLSEVIGHLERRIHGMIESKAVEGQALPSPKGIADLEFIPAAIDAPSRSPALAIPAAARSDPLAALNAMSDEEKIALFT